MVVFLSGKFINDFSKDSVVIRLIGIVADEIHAAYKYVKE